MSHSVILKLKIQKFELNFKKGLSFAFTTLDKRNDLNYFAHYNNSKIAWENFLPRLIMLQV